MFNYKRLTFILIFICIFLLSTESSLEKQIRRNLLNLFDVVVEEGSQVGETAPSSFLDSVENARFSINTIISKQAMNVGVKLESSRGLMDVLLTVSYYLLVFLKFLTNYVITFYPTLLLLLYMFFTSRFFKKEDYGYQDF